MDIWASSSLDREYMYDQVATPRRRDGDDNDAKGLAPALEKDKELERKKSRSPSAERGGSQKNLKQIISALSVLKQLADQQH